MTRTRINPTSAAMKQIVKPSVQEQIYFLQQIQMTFSEGETVVIQDTPEHREMVRAITETLLGQLRDMQAKTRADAAVNNNATL